MTTPTLLIVPGLGGSGPEHWQTLWRTHFPGYRRVEQRDWDRPDLADWVAALEVAVGAAPAPVVLVAHSLACSLVAHWARRGSIGKIAAALLVAPADVDSEAHTPPEVRGFAPIPLAPLLFPAVLVASATDPYMAPERAPFLAECWGARLVEVGDQGHINVASGHGEWPEGRRLLGELLATL